MTHAPHTTAGPSRREGPAHGPADDRGGPGDDELLGRYLSGGGPDSEAAFRALVARHGPMVLGVCRHILDSHHDAEDAFQATFLVLARGAATIRDRRVLAGWLYEVAYRTAVRAGARAARRRALEKEAAEMASPDPPDHDPGWIELRPVLHEEVNRLPEKYRNPVVLCYLEGHTNEEAAALLHWPVGTVKGRLSRARELLHSRLTRRGLVLSAAFLLTRLSRNMVFAEVVPAELIDTTARTVSAGPASAPPSVRELADAEPPLGPAAAPGFLTGLGPRALRIVLAAVVIVAALAFLAYGRELAAGVGSVTRMFGPPAGRLAPAPSPTPTPTPTPAPAACHAAP